MQIVNRHPARDRRALQPFGMAKRAQSIFIARVPMLAHRGAGKFIVPRVAFVIFVLIDEMHDIDDGGFRTFLDEFLFTRPQRFGRNSRQGFGEPHFHIVGAGEGVRILAGAARIHDLLVAREDIRHLAGQGAARAEEVHLKHERGLVLVLFQQILQRRVRDDAAVPIIFPIPFATSGSFAGSKAAIRRSSPSNASSVYSGRKSIS